MNRSKEQNAIYMREYHRRPGVREKSAAYMREYRKLPSFLDYELKRRNANRPHVVAKVRSIAVAFCLFSDESRSQLANWLVDSRHTDRNTRAAATDLWLDYNWISDHYAA